MDRDLMLVIPTKGGDGGSAPACSVAAVLAALVSRHGEGAVGRAVRRGKGGGEKQQSSKAAKQQIGPMPSAQCPVPAPAKRGHLTRGARADGECVNIEGANRVSNASVHLTCEAEGSVELFATIDPFDRAHGMMTLGMKGERQLVPACVRRKRGGNGRPLEGSRPRCYPASSMTSRGVAHDSAYDATYEIALELAGIPGVGVREMDVRRPDGRCEVQIDNHGQALRQREEAMFAMESKYGATGKGGMRDRIRK